MWMSEACAATACARIWLTRWMIGASEAMSRRCSMNSDASGWSPLASSSWDASCRYHSLNWLEISDSSPKQIRGTCPNTSRRASRSCALPGSTDAKSGSGLSASASSASPSGSRLFAKRKLVFSRAVCGLSLGNASWRTKGNPAWRESAAYTSTSETRPRLISSRPSRPPMERCTSRALSRSLRESFCSASSISPSLGVAASACSRVAGT